MDPKKDFEKAFDHYWYKKKPFNKRIRDSMEDEEEICALFFETLNEIGMLDKCYPIQEVK